MLVVQQFLRNDGMLLELQEKFAIKTTVYIQYPIGIN